MRAVVWSDYICPWCYLGQDRNSLLRSLGVSVTARPYELHPALPTAGMPLNRRYSIIAAACAEVGLEFNPPPLVANSRRALLTAEAVRLSQPDAFEDLDRRLFRAYFVDGQNLADPDVLDELVVASGAGPIELDPMHLKASMDEAYEVGVSGTPAWWIDNRLMIPGVQDRSYYERMIERISATPRPS